MKAFALAALALIALGFAYNSPSVGQAYTPADGFPIGISPSGEGLFAVKVGGLWKGCVVRTSGGVTCSFTN